MAPLRRCVHQGCPTLVKQGRCPAHEKTYDQRRGTAQERGYTYRWHLARTQFLSEHPLCIECKALKRRVVATVVDHVIPHKGDERVFWDEANWQPLCGYHHGQKTAREDGGFGR
jgi:5-methylcytosine-specific restriction protein A